MKEFGSDFHYIDSYQSKRAHLTDVYRNALLLADGRQCIMALIRQYGWKRLWMPEYFCYEVIASIEQMTGIEIAFYHDLPILSNDQRTVEELPYMDGDVLFRVNYFGLRDFRSEDKIPIPVIEDHTHDLLGHWALYSNADWCIASLRKSLPVPEGGMMWSPKGFSLDCITDESEENKEIAASRWEGMRMKAAYLNGEQKNKDAFRKKFIDTEGWFDCAEISAIDDNSRNYIEKLDINLWQGAKLKNWKILHREMKTKPLSAENDSCTPFSCILLAESHDAREQLRKRLIARSIYPAILWNVPHSASEMAKDFSSRMLSVHCDGRYTPDDARQLSAIINDLIVI